MYDSPAVWPSGTRSVTLPRKIRVLAYLIIKMDKDKVYIGTVLEAPVPERSASVKINVSLVKCIFVHAPWNCRIIETQARGCVI